MTSRATDEVLDSVDNVDGVAAGATPPADTAEADRAASQPIDVRLRSAIADQVRAMEYARMAVAQAAALLLQPVVVLPRSAPLHRSVPTRKASIDEIRRTLDELRRTSSD